jgi:hypothetical protein
LRLFIFETLPPSLEKKGWGRDGKKLREPGAFEMVKPGFFFAGGDAENKCNF